MSDSCVVSRTCAERDGFSLLSIAGGTRGVDRDGRTRRPAKPRPDHQQTDSAGA
ncbi:MAG: hypothetical protein NXI14_06805 [bacterium]|nr:hypothetical protein [bacterium]